MYKFLLQTKIGPALKSTFYFVIRNCAFFSFITVSCKSLSQDLSVKKNSEIVQYLNSNFSYNIRNVIVNKNNVIIEGNISNNPGNLYLCELRMYDEMRMVTDSFASVSPIDTRQPNFRIQTNRFVTVHDTGY